MMGQIRPLLVINNHNSLTLIKICSDIGAQGHALAPVAVASDRHFDECRQALAGWGTAVCWNGVSIPQGTATAAARTSSPTRRRLRGTLEFLADNLSPGQYARELNIRWKLKRLQKRAAAIFDEHKPNVVLSMSDRNHDYLESCLLLEARRRGIRIILPYVAHYDIEGAMGYRLDTNGRVLAEYAPWTRPTLYKLWAARRLRHTMQSDVFFQHSFLLNAHDKNGSMSAFPWWTGNGLSDVVCVNSRHSFDVYRENRVAEAKLSIVGDIFYDTLFAACERRADLRRELTQKYKLTPDRKLIVLAMPQYAEQGYLDAKRHWEEIERLLSILSRRGADLLISLHPRMDPREYSYLSDKFSSRIAGERLASVLPAADLFVSYYSSTVVWATLCGIPAIVADALGNRLSLFDYLTSVQVVEPRHLSEAVDAALTGVIDFTQDWRELSHGDVFDGRTAHRYWTLLESAAASRICGEMPHNH